MGDGVESRRKILQVLGIRVEYGEPVEAGLYRGSFKTMGDEEHAEIVRIYLEERIPHLSRKKVFEPRLRCECSHKLW